MVNDNYSDVFSRVRRRKTLSLAAEIQWELLPPLTFATDKVVISCWNRPTTSAGTASTMPSPAPTPT